MCMAICSHFQFQTNLTLFYQLYQPLTVHSIISRRPNRRCHSDRTRFPRYIGPKHIITECRISFTYRHIIIISASQNQIQISNLEDCLTMLEEGNLTSLTWIPWAAQVARRRIQFILLLRIRIIAEALSAVRERHDCVSALCALPPAESDRLRERAADMVHVVDVVGAAEIAVGARSCYGYC
ncbi:hypothetical protein BDW71DRAFT_178173 [Aspergillus fruticulosus]